MDGGWYVYIVRCNDGTLYTGVTTDLVRRVRQHNGELVGGARYTAARRPVTLVGRWELKNRSEAQKREYAIKSMSRTQKLVLLGDDFE